MTDQHEIDMSKSCNSARKYEFFFMISQYANPVLVTCKHLQCPDRTEIVKKIQDLFRPHVVSKIV